MSVDRTYHVQHVFPDVDPGSSGKEARNGIRGRESTAHHILIADDEETFRQTTAELLAADGYRVSEAVNGNQARDLLERDSFDLVIADLKMPGNADLTLVREVKKLAPGVHVILVTGFPSIASAIAAYDLPVSAYLIKPFDYRLLLVHVRQVLKEQDRVRERERLQRRLQQEQERYRELFLAIPDAVIGIDVQGHITAFNRQAEQLFGYQGYELTGAPLDQLIPDRYRSDHRNWVQGYLQQPHRRPMASGLNITARHRSGREIPVDIQLSPVGEGGGMQVLAIIRPIRELERITRDLKIRCETQAREIRASEEERELMSEGLARLQEVAEEEALPTLDAVLEKLSYLTDGADMGELRDQALTLRQALLHLSELVRLAERRVRREPLDLSAMACELLTGSDETEGISLTVWEGAEAFADPILVRILLQELLGWALRHAGERPGSRVEFGHRRERGRLMFYVVTQRHEPGHQCEGLSAPLLRRCQEVVELHGGSLRRLEEEDVSGCGYGFSLGPSTSNEEKTDP